MKIIKQITIADCRKHLKTQGSGVQLNLEDMPGPISEYSAFQATLEERDVDRIFLWFEFRKHTKDGTAKLTDALPECLEESRFKQIVEGAPAKRWEPIDLHTAGFEPTLLTHDIERGPLYCIDGNHRLVAHYLTKKSFVGAPIYVSTHPNMLQWAYITKAAREWMPK